MTHRRLQGRRPRPPGEPERARPHQALRRPGRRHREAFRPHARARREVAIYDQQLRSRFDWLREPDPDAIATPPLFMAFDLMYHQRRDLTGRPLRDRRARSEEIVTNNDLVFPVRRLAPDGLEAWKQVVERGYEGYVAKDERGAYEAGLTRRWLKLKQKGWTVWYLQLRTLVGGRQKLVISSVDLSLGSAH